LFIVPKRIYARRSLSGLCNAVFKLALKITPLYTFYLLLPCLKFPREFMSKGVYLDYASQSLTGEYIIVLKITPQYTLLFPCLEFPREVLSEGVYLDYASQSLNWRIYHSFKNNTPVHFIISLSRVPKRSSVRRSLSGLCIAAPVISTASKLQVSFLLFYSINNFCKS
jgi:hypothetical protein